MKLNKNTGQIEGWDSLFALLEMQDKDAEKSIQKLGIKADKVAERLRNQYTVE